MTTKQEVLSELDDLIQEGKKLNASYRFVDMGVIQSDVSETDFRSFAASTFAAIQRIAGRDSEYFKSLPKLDDKTPLNLAGYSNTKVPTMAGTLVALRNAVDKGLLVSLESRLRVNIHDDFLQQAKALCAAGFHVAAMVLIGGVMEDHLQKLCVKNGLVWKSNGSISAYNDLLHGTAYDKPTWRRIQSIGDVRNNAAHGQGAKVSPADTEDAFTFVSRFIVDCPA